MNQPFNPQQGNSSPIADPIDALLDAHLSGQAEELAPSSGFVVSVMESIHAQASEPPPIAFPWRRVVPGIISVLCGLAALIVFAMRALYSGAGGPATDIHVRHTFSFAPAFTPGEVAVCWVLVAVCLSVAAMAASFRLTGRSQ